jgi:hypothetical protein
MAQIHGISGSTQYLLKGAPSVNGKRLETLEEIRHFYQHYNEILAETRMTVTRKQDEQILGLSKDESRLDKELREGLAQQTVIVDKRIEELKQKISVDSGFLSRISYRLQYWVAVMLREHHIEAPYAGIAGNLRDVMNRKATLIAFKPSVIEQECNALTRSYNFLKTNEPFLIGAYGEEAVIGSLSHLPDEYHVINDVNLRFNPAIRWKETGEYIQSCQIDHIVAGPTGLFLLETKNWKSSNLEVNADVLVHQVRRSSYALWYYTGDYYRYYERPKVLNVVISLHGVNSGRKMDKYIDIITPDQICDYIQRRRYPTLSDETLKKFVKIVERQETCRSKY